MLASQQAGSVDPKLVFEGDIAATDVWAWCGGLR